MLQDALIDIQIKRIHEYKRSLLERGELVMVGEVDELELWGPVMLACRWCKTIPANSPSISTLLVTQLGPHKPSQVDCRGDDPTETMWVRITNQLLGLLAAGWAPIIFATWTSRIWVGGRGVASNKDTWSQNWSVAPVTCDSTLPTPSGPHIMGPP